MWVLQVVCRLVVPLVLSLRRVVLRVLWAVVSSVVPMVRVTGGRGLEGGCRWCNGRWWRWRRRWWIG